MRYFNTAGPIRSEDHYAIPPLSRLDAGRLLSLIRQKKYFVLHAPRQTGKTSALLALRDRLNRGEWGDFRCVYANFEVGQAGREDTGRAMRAMLRELADRSLLLGDAFLGGAWRDILEDAGPDAALGAALTRWSLACPRPLVLLIDEIDALVGDTLVSVVRQLRAGYDKRPEAFPQSVVLCGLRDVEDYRTELEAPELSGGSPFNIIARSFRLGDFTEAETAALLRQHTEETGQRFEPAALSAVWEQARGQPWLVNALAYEACFENEFGRDRNRAIPAGDILAAREALVLRRSAHIAQLAHRLREDRVRRVIEPLLSAGESLASARDVRYVRDLGLVARDRPLRIANPIYREVVPRELTAIVQEELPQETSGFTRPDGGLDADRLLGAFQQFFREHSEHWIGRFAYREAGPQLLLQAFCQRILNGGGRVEREYGLGRGRTDLLLMWPRAGGWERFVVECKVVRGGLAATKEGGLAQTAGYMDRCGAEAGHLVLFDRRAGKSWAERIFRSEEEHDGHPITVWGM